MAVGPVPHRSKTCGHCLHWIGVIVGISKPVRAVCFRISHYSGLYTPFFCGTHFNVFASDIYFRIVTNTSELYSYYLHGGLVQEGIALTVTVSQMLWGGSHLRIILLSTQCPKMTCIPYMIV